MRNAPIAGWLRSIRKSFSHKRLRLHFSPPSCPRQRIGSPPLAFFPPAGVVGCCRSPDICRPPRCLHSGSVPGVCRSPAPPPSVARGGIRNAFSHGMNGTFGTMFPYALLHEKMKLCLTGKSRTRFRSFRNLLPQRNSTPSHQTPLLVYFRKPCSLMAAPKRR